MAVLHNFIICVNAVIPSAIYLIIGILLKTFHVIDDEGVRKFTHVIFVTLFPFIMFDNLYGKDLSEHLDWKIIIYAMGFTAAQIIISWIFVCIINKKDYDRGAMIQALFRSNIVLLGLPVMINFMGKSSVTPMAMIILFVVPTYNVMIVVIFEHFRGGHASIGHTLLKVLSNPIIDGGIAALIVMALGITLPEPIYNAVTALSDSTAPIAMILLGAGLNFGEFGEDRKILTICVAGKLIVFPALCVAGAALMGFRGADIVALMLMAAAPAALASYAMASSMGGNGRLAGETVVLSTVLSCFTIPVWLFLLMTMGLIT